MKKVLLSVLALVPCLAMAAPGAYISADAGLNSINPDISGFPTSRGAVGGIGGGYLWGNNTVNYGVEVDAMGAPNSTSNMSGPDGFGGTLAVKNKFDTTSLSLLGVLKFTSSTGLVGFGKAGAAYIHQKVTQTFSDSSFGGPLGSTSASGETIAPEVAIGGGYMFNQNVEMDLTADVIFAHTGAQTGSYYTPYRSGNLLLGLTYHFA